MHHVCNNERTFFTPVYMIVVFKSTFYNILRKDKLPVALPTCCDDDAIRYLVSLDWIAKTCNIVKQWIEHVLLYYTGSGAIKGFLLISHIQLSLCKWGFLILSISAIKKCFDYYFIKNILTLIIQQNCNPM